MSKIFILFLSFYIFECKVQFKTDNLGFVVSLHFFFIKAEKALSICYGKDILGNK